MTSIEELSRQLANCHFFKDFLKEQVKDCLSELSKPNDNANITLHSLVQEIGAHLSTVTELALEEQNSQKYMSLAIRNEEMYQELEKKMERETRTALSDLQKQIEEIRTQIQQLENTMKVGPSVSHVSKLKTQRKAITKVLLETSKLMCSGKTKSTIDPRRLRNQAEESQLQLDDNNQVVNSRFSQELDGSSLPLSSEKANSLRNQLMKEISLVKKEQMEVKEDVSKFILKWQSKLQMNLEGVWNVISDLTNRISRLEPLESVISMCDE